jgi:hypothetical protein
MGIVKHSQHQDVKQSGLTEAISTKRNQTHPLTTQGIH